MGIVKIIIHQRTSKLPLLILAINLSVDGSFLNVWKAGKDRRQTTPMTTERFMLLLVNITNIWKRKHVIDPSCLLTEKLSERPLNYREQIMKSQPSM